MFCKKCGNLLMPKDGKMKCSCGYVQSEEKLIEKKKKDVKIEVMKDEGESLPIISADCKYCGNKKAYFWSMQTRSADEPETRFFRCVKCNKTWREY